MKVLVAYASKHGSTAEIANALATRLAERGLASEVRTAGEATLEGYDAVVLGSGVYVGTWMKEATSFAKANVPILSTMPVWLFSSGPTGDAHEHGVTEKQLRDLDELAHPRAHRVFGGALDLAKLGFVERRVVRMVKAPVGDFRDWDQIRAFADEIADDLLAATASSAG
jgi:menaquinone-dependent protoporphyrinogen oxidase